MAAGSVGDRPPASCTERVTWVREHVELIVAAAMRRRRAEGSRMVMVRSSDFA